MATVGADLGSPRNELEPTSRAEQSWVQRDRKEAGGGAHFGKDTSFSFLGKLH